jgi:hypothetical protein
VLEYLQSHSIRNLLLANSVDEFSARFSVERSLVADRHTVETGRGPHSGTRQMETTAKKYQHAGSGGLPHPRARTGAALISPVNTP